MSTLSSRLSILIRPFQASRAPKTPTATQCAIELTQPPRPSGLSHSQPATRSITLDKLKVNRTNSTLSTQITKSSRIVQAQVSTLAQCRLSKKLNHCWGRYRRYSRWCSRQGLRIGKKRINCRSYLDYTLIYSACKNLYYRRGAACNAHRSQDKQVFRWEAMGTMAVSIRCCSLAMWCWARRVRQMRISTTFTNEKGMWK